MLKKIGVKNTKESKEEVEMSRSRRFFKPILCPTFHDHKLRIPDKFVEKYGDELCELVRLMVPTGGIWSVRVEKAGNAIWLRDGLHKFMEDNCIGFLYLLMFKYVGNSIFKVNIFDLNANEIEYPTTSNSATYDDANRFQKSARVEDDDSQNEKRDEHTASGQKEQNNSYHESDDDDDDKSIEILGYSMDHQLLGKLIHSPEFVTRNKHSIASAERRKVNRCYITRNKRHKIRQEAGSDATSIQHSSPPRRSKVYQSNKATREVTADKVMMVSSNKSNRISSSTNGRNSSAKISLPKNPLYEVTLKQYNIDKNIVKLPIEFARLYLSYKRRFITLQDADENEWEVYCLTTSCKGCYLSRGWNKFMRENNLMTGDLCIFEPFQINGEVKLKVKISRAIDHAANIKEKSEVNPTR